MFTHRTYNILHHIILVKIVAYDIEERLQFSGKFWKVDNENIQLHKFKQVSNELDTRGQCF